MHPINFPEKVADLLDEALETAKKGDDGAEPKLSEPKEGNWLGTGTSTGTYKMRGKRHSIWMNQSPTIYGKI